MKYNKYMSINNNARLNGYCIFYGRSIKTTEILERGSDNHWRLGEPNNRNFYACRALEGTA